MENNFKLISVLLIILLSVLSFLAIKFYKPEKTEVEEKNSDNKSFVEINGNKIQVELARTPIELREGLMNREKLDPQTGMLFIFDYDSVHSFWMKNTLIALDMIWINKDGEVVYIYENAQPCGNVIEAVCNSIIPQANARYVLEVNAGEAKKFNIKKGDQVKMHLP